jgi:hypothetical protein
LEAVSAAGFEMLTKRMANEIASCRSPREQLFALLRAYVDYGVENPARANRRSNLTRIGVQF